jgi:hypothetical protein
MAALTGDELLSKVKELTAQGANKTTLARETGYVSQKKDGTDRTNFTGFYEALLTAKGTLPGASGGGTRPGRPLSYRTKVLSGVGHAVIGTRYLEQIGAVEGDELEIHVGRGRITVVPAKAPDPVAA